MDSAFSKASLPLPAPVAVYPAASLAATAEPLAADAAPPPPPPGGLAPAIAPDAEAERLSRKRRREEEHKHDDDPERAKRTLFVGNVPVKTTAKQLTRLFVEFLREGGAASGGSAVESVRFRSVPIKATAVAPGADYRAMLKAASIKGELNEARDTMNGAWAGGERGLLTRSPLPIPATP